MATLNPTEVEKVKKIKDIYADFLEALEDLRGERHRAIVQLVQELDAQELKRTQSLIANLSSQG